MMSETIPEILRVGSNKLVLCADSSQQLQLTKLQLRSERRLLNYIANILMDPDTGNGRRCGGHMPAITICTQVGCSKPTLMCENSKCDCRQVHQNHTTRELVGFEQEMRPKAQALEGYLNKCSVIERLIGKGAWKFREIQQQTNIDNGASLEKLRAHHRLLVSLLVGNLEQATTGNDINMMTKQIERAQRAYEVLRGITSLDLDDNGLRDDGAKTIVQQFPQLTQLRIGTNGITDDGVRIIVQGLPHLTELGIGTNLITDAGARIVAQGLPHLTWLNIAYNKITDEGAKAIASGLPKLIELQIGFNQLKNKGAMAIVQGLPQLTDLWINSNKFTVRARRFLQAVYQNARIAT